MVGLKNVFDDLFDTAKISKSSENIKKLIKENKEKLKDMRHKIEIMKGVYEKHFIMIQELAMLIQKRQQTGKEITENEELIQNDEELKSIGPLQKLMGKNQEKIESQNELLKKITEEVGEISFENKQLLFDKFQEKELEKLNNDNVENFLINLKDSFENINEKNIENNQLENGFDVLSSTSTSRDVFKSPRNLEFCKTQCEYLYKMLKSKITEINNKMETVHEHLKQHDKKPLIKEIQTLIETLFIKTFDANSFSNQIFLDKQFHYIL